MLKKTNSWLVSLVDGPAQSEEEQAWRLLRRQFSMASKRGVTLVKFLSWSGQEAFFDGFGERRLGHFFAAAITLLTALLSELILILVRHKVSIPFSWILDLTFVGLAIYFGQLSLRSGFRYWQWRRLAKQLPGEASPAPARA